MDPVTGMLILGGLNAGMGAMKAQQAAKQRKMEADLRAAEIEASPWTGKAPSTQVTTQTLNPWAEMAGGAINAAGQAAALQNAGLFKSADVTPAAGGLDAGLSVGGESMSPGAQQSANYFSMKEADMNPFTKPMSSQSSWSMMAPSLYAKK